MTNELGYAPIQLGCQILHIGMKDQTWPILHILFLKYENSILGYDIYNLAIAERKVPIATALNEVSHFIARISCCMLFITGA